MALPKNKNQRAFALITVLLVMVIMATFICAMLSYNKIEYSFSGQARNVNLCYFLAQSGIEYIRAYAETWGLTPANPSFKKTLKFTTGTAVININSFKNGKYTGTIEGRQGFAKTILDITMEIVRDNNANYVAVDWKYASVR